MRRNRDRLARLRVHHNVPGVTLRHDLPGCLVENLVLELDRRTLEFTHGYPDDDPVVVLNLALIADMGFDDWEKEILLFEALVRESAISAPSAPCLLEPVQIVRVICMPHLIRVSIPNANPLLRESNHE